MTREEVFLYAREKYDAEPEYLWDGETHAVLRNKETNKWFAICMCVKNSHLRLPGEGTTDIVNVKCPPLLVEELLHEEGFLPAYHMNKKLWISVRLDGSADDSAVKKMLDESFLLVDKKIQKKRKKPAK